MPARKSARAPEAPAPVPPRARRRWPKDAFGYADLTVHEVPLPAVHTTGAAGPIKAGVYLDHVARYNAMHLLDDYALVESGPAVHTIAAVLDFDMLTWQAEGAARAAARATWDQLTALRGVTPMTRSDGTQALRIADLEVVEFPGHLVDTWPGWWPDAFDAHGTELGLVVEDLMTDPPDYIGVPPNDVVWFKMLHVAPAFRGHRLGAALLAHALWLLVADETRVAVCEAVPLESRDGAEDEEEPSDPAEARRRRRASRAACRQLARYYARVGLRPWRRESRTASDGVVLWHWGGWRLPFDRDLDAAHRVPGDDDQ